MDFAVQLEGVTQVYVSGRGATLAVHNVDLSVRIGEFVSIVGPSGCGKTTLLSIMAGLLSPTAGTVSVLGSAVASPSDKIGYMLQQDYLFPWRTILDNTLIGLELKRRRNAETTQYARHLLEEMGLGHVQDRYPHQLSGGMRQRVALVRTLATSPDILLLDEPFTALDYQTKLQLEDLVAETLRAHRKTAVLVTHDISEAIAMSDRIVILGRNPGTIRKEVPVPEPIRRDVPFLAREQPGFHDIFRVVWRELDITIREGESSR